MTKVIAGATMSLDGFVQDRTGSAAPLYADFDEFVASAHMRALQSGTGAVLMGRRTFDMAEDADSYAASYEFQVPIFVVTHTPPPVEPRRNDRLWFTFVTDGVEAAVKRAVEAAGDRDVTCVGGAHLLRQLLAAGLVDELSVDIVPVLLGAGLRLFGDTAPTTLEKVSVQEVGVRTCLRYRVLPAEATG